MARKIATVVALIVLVVGAFLYISRPEGDVRNEASTGTDIIAFGDSLVAGAGSTKRNDLVSQLSEKLGQPIVNLGRGGDTTAAGLARIDALDRYNPKVVLVLLGGNDFLRGVPPEQTFSNLRQIIEEIQSRGAAVVLLGIRGGILRDPYAAEFESLAREYETAYVPDVLNGIITRSEYMADAIHPNDAGYDRIADRIFPTLQSLVK